MDAISADSSVDQHDDARNGAEIMATLTKRVAARPRIIATVIPPTSSISHVAEIGVKAVDADGHWIAGTYQGELAVVRERLRLYRNRSAHSKGAASITRQEQDEAAKIDTFLGHVDAMSSDDSFIAFHPSPSIIVRGNDKDIVYIEFIVGAETLIRGSEEMNLALAAEASSAGTSGSQAVVAANSSSSTQSPLYYAIGFCSATIAQLRDTTGSVALWVNGGTIWDRRAPTAAKRRIKGGGCFSCAAVVPETHCMLDVTMVHVQNGATSGATSNKPIAEARGKGGLVIPRDADTNKQLGGRPLDRLRCLPPRCCVREGYHYQLVVELRDAILTAASRDPANAVGGRVLPHHILKRSVARHIRCVLDNPRLFDVAALHWMTRRREQARQVALSNSEVLDKQAVLSQAASDLATTVAILWEIERPQDIGTTLLLRQRASGSALLSP